MKTDFRRLAESDHIPIIRSDTEEYLRKLVLKKKVKKILEYGTAIGYSADFFRSLGDNVEVYSVEKDVYAHEIAKYNLAVLGGSERVHLILGDALSVTERLLKESHGNFDIIFIDGGKSHYREILNEAMRLCKCGGIILSDDIWQRGLTKMNISDAKRKHRTSMRNMQDYLEYIQNEPCLKTKILDIGDGLAVSEYIGKNE